MPELRDNRPAGCPPARRANGFTLIELLVVVSILGVLVALLLPSLSGARNQARAVKCLGQLHVFGQGLTIYTADNRDVLVAGRLPKLDDCNWAADVGGRRKYRPTFLVMMSREVGADPFADPQACRNMTDRLGEAGDRQNYASPVYVCPTAGEWTDERNASYGYNYQFLGNSRLRDPNVPDSFKNWPVFTTVIRTPADTVAIADSMGTAAAYPARARQPYDNNSRDPDRLGNEGFNLDPPRIAPGGEMADLEEDGGIITPGSGDIHRSAADPRHQDRTNVMFVDTHAESTTLGDLGYELDADGTIRLDGDNIRWTVDRRNEPWLP